MCIKHCTNIEEKNNKNKSIIRILTKINKLENKQLVYNLILKKFMKLRDLVNYNNWIKLAISKI